MVGHSGRPAYFAYPRLILSGGFSSHVSRDHFRPEGSSPLPMLMYARQQITNKTVSRVGKCVCSLLVWKKIRGFLVGISMSMIPTLYGLEYLGSLPYRGTLCRKPSGGRALGFLPLTAGSTTPTICFFRWPRTDSGKIKSFHRRLQIQQFNLK